MAINAAQIDQWYMNLDTGEIFFVTGLDPKSGTIEIQSIEGDVSELDETAWSALPLAMSEEPQMDSDDLEHDTLDEAYPDDLASPVAKLGSMEPGTG